MPCFCAAGWLRKDVIQSFVDGTNQIPPRIIHPPPTYSSSNIDSQFAERATCLNKIFTRFRFKVCKPQCSDGKGDSGLVVQSKENGVSIDANQSM